MYAKFAEFVKYNNAFTFIVMSLFFGFGISFAANPELREAVYASEETVVAADNGVILRSDLDNFDFNLKIDAVTEDEKNYYAAYSYRTLAVEDGVWRERQVVKNLTVSKESLAGGDFGLRVARELGENINYELSYLKRVKKAEEEKGESKKTVTVEYSGLIGKFLDPKEMVIEGYDPVVPEPVVPPAAPEAVASDPVSMPENSQPVLDAPSVASVIEALLPPPVIPEPVQSPPAPEPASPLPVIEDPLPVAPIPAAIPETPSAQPPVVIEPVAPPAAPEPEAQ